MGQYDFAWAITQIKAGERVCREAFTDENKYIELSLDRNNNEFIRIVDENAGYQHWQDTHADLLASDWSVYDGEIIELPPVNDYHVRGIVTVGYYFDRPSQSQHDYGYYKKWGIGSFDLISTDLFDPQSIEVATCCGAKNNSVEGFIFQIAKEGTGENIKFLDNNRNAPLTVFVGNDRYDLGAYTGLSGYKNYYWNNTNMAIALREKYFNAAMVGKSFEITLQFHLE